MVVLNIKNPCLSIVLLLSGCSASRVDNDKGLDIDHNSFPAKYSAEKVSNPLHRDEKATSQIDMYESKVKADLQASLDKLSCPEKQLQESLNRVYKSIEEYREIVDSITNVVKDPIHGVEGIDAAATSYVKQLLRMMDKMKREIYESAKTWEIREERFELYRMFMQITSGVCSNKTKKLNDSINSGITEPTNRKTILHAISNVLVSFKYLAELCLQQFEKSGGKLQDVFYIKPLSIDLQIEVMLTSCNGQLPPQISGDVANERVDYEHKGDASVKSDVSYDLATQAALTAKSITDEMIAKIAAAKAKKSGLKSLVDEIFDELTNMLADKGKAMLKELVSSADDSKGKDLAVKEGSAKV